MKFEIIDGGEIIDEVHLNYDFLCCALEFSVHTLYLFIFSFFSVKFMPPFVKSGVWS